jgi:penicillin amidase
VTRANLIRNTFGDELRELYPEFLYTLNFNYNIMDKIIDEPSSLWWDDINTAVKETRDQIIIKSVENALREIREKLGVHRESWRWGQLHKYRFTHPLGQVKFLDKLFNPKPIPAPGDRDTINNSYFGYKRHYHSDGATYDATVIPSYRFIVDLSDIDNALAMNSTGQWGNPFSRHYSNVIQSWADVEYHPLYFDESDIEKNKWKELRLSPE